MDLSKLDAELPVTQEEEEYYDRMGLCPSVAAERGIIEESILTIPTTLIRFYEKLAEELGTHSTALIQSVLEDYRQQVEK